MDVKKTNYRRIATVALPIIFQNLIDASVNSVDTLMLNSVGQDAISATSLGTSYAGLIFMLLYGIGTGVTMLAAQYYGKGDYKTIELIEGLGHRFAIAICAFGAFTCLFCPRLVLRIFTNEEALIELGAQYLLWIAPGLFFWAVSSVYCSVLRCIDKVMITTVIEIIALISNMCLNAVFIYGLFGAPKLGVQGVAIATSLSRLIQLICCMIVSRKAAVKLTLKTMFVRNKLLLNDFMSMAFPAIGNDAVWSLAFTMYSVILGHLGNDAVAANAIANVVRNLGCVACYGVASAAGIIVGQILGEGDIEGGKAMGKTMFNLSIITGIIGGLVVIAIMPFALQRAALSETSLDYLKFMLWVNAYYITGTSVNSTLIAGVFRAGGDSKFGLICDSIDMWCYAVPIGFLAAFVFKLPVKWVYFIICTDEFVKWPWVFKRYFSMKWAKNITRENIADASE